MNNHSSTETLLLISALALLSCTAAAPCPDWTFQNDRPDLGEHHEGRRPLSDDCAKVLGERLEEETLLLLGAPVFKGTYGEGERELFHYRFGVDGHPFLVLVEAWLSPSDSVCWWRAVPLE